MVNTRRWDTDKLFLFISWQMVLMEPCLQTLKDSLCGGGRHFWSRFDTNILENKVINDKSETLGSKLTKAHAGQILAQTEFSGKFAISIANKFDALVSTTNDLGPTVHDEGIGNGVDQNLVNSL